MSTIAFTSHGMEFSIGHPIAKPDAYDWWVFGVDGKIKRTEQHFPTIEAAKADACRFAEAHTATVDEQPKSYFAFGESNYDGPITATVTREKE